MGGGGGVAPCEEGALVGEESLGLDTEGNLPRGVGRGAGGL